MLLLAACDDGGDAVRASSLPPGMRGARSSNADASPPPVPYESSTPRIAVRADTSWPHDRTAYTQGLSVTGERLLESTGLEGSSGVREVQRFTGEVLRRTELAAPMFGEGIAVWSDRVYQLTWRHQRGYVFDVTTLALVDSFTYSGEGWGLTTDGDRFFMSDGTSTLRVIDPDGFRVERTIQVREAGQPVWMLNELEWVRGELLANVYKTDLIARIDPATGHVLGWLDVGSLLTPVQQERVRARDGVANGIAFDPARGRLLLTGKRWPRLFEIDWPAGQRD